MKQYATRFITAVCLKASAFMFIGSKKNNQDYYTHSAYEIFRLENHYLDEDDIEEFNISDLTNGYCIRTKSSINFNVKYPIKYDEY